MSEDQSGFMVDGRLYPFPDSEFSTEEVCAVEEISGMTIYDYGAAMEEAAVTGTLPPFRALAALLFVAMHRDDPRISVQRVLKMKASEFSLVSGDDADADPLGPENERSRSGDLGRTDEISGGSSTGSSSSPTEAAVHA